MRKLEAAELKLVASEKKETELKAQLERAETRLMASQEECKALVERFMQSAETRLQNSQSLHRTMSSQLAERESKQAIVLIAATTHAATQELALAQHGSRRSCCSASA